MGTDFVEMSSCTALTWHTGTKTVFYQSMKCIGIVTNILNFKSDRRQCKFKEIKHITIRNSYLGFNASVMLVSISLNVKIIRKHLLWYIWSKIFSSSRNGLLNMSEKTSPPKLFPSDCITLYHWCSWHTLLEETLLKGIL